MEAAAWLSVIRSNATRLAEAGVSAGLEASVPTCTDWRVADLVIHQGGVHRWAGDILEARSQTDPGPFPSPPEGAELMGWFEEGVGRLLEVLGAVDPHEPVWNWAAGVPGPAGFWLRRMAHETIIHRVDAEAAAGWPSRVDPPHLAADGLDELLGFLTVSYTFDPRMADLRGSLGFSATDVARDWRVDFGADGVAVHREQGGGDARLRGSACDLLLLAYNRGSVEGVGVEGDGMLVREWRDRVRFF